MKNPFNLVKQRVPILDIISHYISLKKIGYYWKGQCPFHDEKTASFTVSPHKEIFYCFGCQMGGDVISFVAKIENCSQFQAVKQLADKYSIELPESFSDESFRDLDTKKRFFALHEVVAEWAHQVLLKTPTVLEYLARRKFSLASIERFKIGYFPEHERAIKDLSNYSSRHNFLLKDLIEAGILHDGKSLYSPFEDRLLFPIRDHWGNYCGFGGRVIQPDDQRSKYYNSREHIFFQKGSLLFGFDAAKKEIQKTGIVFLVEGYTDCIALHQHGYSNTVATLGTACTHEHLKQLSAHAHTLYVLYDSDSAGQKATLRLAQMCWEVNLDIKVIMIPDAKDPASFFETQTDLQPAIDQAQDILYFFLMSLGSDFSSKPLTLKLQAMRSFLEIIKKLEDPLKQEILLQKASILFGLPLLVLKQELGSHKKNSFIKKQSPESNKLINAYEISNLEKKFIYVILNKIDLLKNKQVKDLLEYLPEPFKKIMEKIYNEFSKTDEPQTISTFFSFLDENEKIALSEILFKEEENNDEIDQIFLLLEKKYWKKIVQVTQQKLSQAEHIKNFDTKQEIIESFLELKKRLLHKGLI